MLMVPMRLGSSSCPMLSQSQTPADGIGKWRIYKLVANIDIFNRRICLMFEISSIMKSKDICIVVSLTVQNLNL